MISRAYSSVFLRGKKIFALLREKRMANVSAACRTLISTYKMNNISIQLLEEIFLGNC